MYTFKPFKKEDIPKMYEMLGQDFIEEVWGKRKTFEKMKKKYLEHIKDSSLVSYFIYYNQRLLGHIQGYDVKDKDLLKEFNYPKDSWGIDTFIGDKSELGKGHGARFLIEFIEKLATEQYAKKIIVDPKPNNVRAIKMYKKVGFVSNTIIDSQYGKLLIMELDVNNIGSSAD